MDIIEEAVYVWEAWNSTNICLANAMMRLRMALKREGVTISNPGPHLHERAQWASTWQPEKKREIMAKPGTLEYLYQLLAIAESSDHPMDKAATVALERMIAKREANNEP